MTGKNLQPLIQGETDKVYAPDESIGMEAAGHSALYKGDMKLVKNGKSYGDGTWQLYNLAKDPGETNDLKETQSQLFAEMLQHYSEYTEEFGVLEMDADYEPLLEIQNKLMRNIKKAAIPWLIGALFLTLLFFMRRRILSFLQT